MAEYGLVDGPFGSSLPASCYTVDGTPIVRGSNLSLGQSRFKVGDFVFVSEETAKRLARSICLPDDIIFTKKGTLGQTGIIPRDTKFPKFLLSSNQMKLTVSKEVADPLFVYYYVSSPASREKIVRESTASGVPKINVAYLRQFLITLPPLSEQRAIARTLGALDDKLELNRRMNHTLEEMAQALFKSWFVDFDPVTAKAAGRKPFGMNEETAALFPDRFVELELRLMPEGWHFSSICTIASIISGGTPRTSQAEYWGGTIPWFSVVDTPPARSIFVLDTEKKITERGLNESPTQLLEVGTTIITARGTVGNVAIAGVPVAMNQSCYALKGINGYEDFFTYFATRELVEELRQRAHGSVFDTIIRSTFESIPMPIPDLAIASAFERKVSSLLLRIKSNVEEARTLSALRDTLLPKLLSGEIRVRQAENLVAEAV